MTDRELLEKAAKAAGVKIKGQWSYTERMYADTDQGWWNPLTDDGDALRLAVKRRFHINIFLALDGDDFDTPGFVEIWSPGDIDPLHTEYVQAGDYEAATRRAIVRAAAAIGETK